MPDYNSCSSSSSLNSRFKPEATNSSTSSNPSTSSYPSGDVANLLYKCIQDCAGLDRKYTELESRVVAAEAKQKDQSKLYEEIRKLSVISRWAIILLMAVPLLQVVACIIVVYAMGIQDSLSPILNWFLGAVSVFSIFDVIVIIVKFVFIEQKFERLNEAIEEIKKSSAQKNQEI